MARTTTPKKPAVRNAPKSYDLMAAQLIQQHIVALKAQLGTQDKVAEILGVDQSTISKNTRRTTKYPSLRLLIALARALRTSMDDLLGLTLIDHRSLMSGPVAAAAELAALRQRIVLLEAKQAELMSSPKHLKSVR